MHWSSLNTLMTNQPLPLGKYQILGTLGQGGSDVVYQALDLALQRTAALWVLARRLLAGSRLPRVDLRSPASHG
jgi:hypothetical protein